MAASTHSPTSHHIPPPPSPRRLPFVDASNIIPPSPSLRALLKLQSFDSQSSMIPPPPQLTPRHRRVQQQTLHSNTQRIAFMTEPTQRRTPHVDFDVDDEHLAPLSSVSCGSSSTTSPMNSPFSPSPPSSSQPDVPIVLPSNDVVSKRSAVDMTSLVRSHTPHKLMRVDATTDVSMASAYFNENTSALSPPHGHSECLSPPRRLFAEFTLPSAFSPDPKAFIGERELRKKTPRSTRKICPPTPVRLKQPARLSRANSLYDTKVLTPTNTQAAFTFPLPSSASLALHSPFDLQHHHHHANHHQAESPFDLTVNVPLSRPIFANEFRHHQVIGEGSFYQVYSAIHCESSVRYAIKRSRDVFRGKRDRADYLREYSLLKELGPHPNIIDCIRCWQEELHFFVQLEYCERNLRQHAEMMEADGHIISDVTLAQWGLQIADALHHIHSRSILHLDLKPDNVLLTTDGCLKLGDFGQARHVNDVRDGSEGDCQYMAHELLRAGPKAQRLNSTTQQRTSLVDDEEMMMALSDEMSNVTSNEYATPPMTPHPHPSVDASVSAELGGVCYGTDIFSLGMLIFEFATQSELPKEGEMWHKLREGQAAPYIKGHVGAAMEEIILAMLNPISNKRPNAQQLIAAFNTVITHSHS